MKIDIASKLGITNQWLRFGWLVGGLVAGVFIVKCFANDIFCWMGLTTEARRYFLLPLGSLPVVALLWIFRTYDTRQQIEKTQTQINQSKLFQGLNNLASQQSLSIDIGVAQLIDLSKTNPTYNDEIRLAFIQRLKVKPDPIEMQKSPHPPLERRGEKVECGHYKYAQHILHWLIDHPGSGSMDLSGCRFDRQEFTMDIPFQKFFTRKNNSKECNFSSAKLLKGAVFSRCYLPNAKFQFAEWSRANFSDAVLSGANLSGAILRGLSLRNLNLCYVDLRYADLNKVDLRGANLIGADLRYADLSNVKITPSRLEYAKINTQTKGLDRFKITTDVGGIITECKKKEPARAIKVAENAGRNR